MRQGWQAIAAAGGIALALGAAPGGDPRGAPGSAQAGAQAGAPGGARAGAGTDPCAQEVSDPQRAACLGHAAEVALMRIEARIATLAAGDQGADAAALHEFATALARGQTVWRREMEAACRALGPRLSRETCRLDAATARAAEIEAVLAEARAANGLSADVAPDCVLILRPRPGQPPGPARARIECLPPPALDPFPLTPR